MTQRDDRMRHHMLDRASRELPDVVRTAWGVVNEAIPLQPSDANNPHKANDRTVIRKAAFDKVLSRLLEDLDALKA